MIFLVFAGNLVATVIIEGAIIALLFRRRDYVYYSFLGNVLTNPALNLVLVLVMTYIGKEMYYPALALLEVSAVLVEAFVLKKLCGFKAAKALWVSALANAVSFCTGLLICSVVKV